MAFTFTITELLTALLIIAAIVLVIVLIVAAAKAIPCLEKLARVLDGADELVEKANKGADDVSGIISDVTGTVSNISGIIKGNGNSFKAITSLVNTVAAFRGLNNKSKGKK